MNFNNGCIVKQWDSLKVIIDTESVLYDSENNDLGTEKVIFANGPIKKYVSFIQIPSDDYNDYFDNYLAKEGERNFLRKGWTNTFSKNGISLFSFKLTDETNVDKEAFLYGGYVKTDENTQWGDSISIEIVHSNGTTVIVSYVKDEYLVAGKQIIYFDSPATSNIPIASKIPKGFYIRVRYVSTGIDNDVKVHLGASYRWI